MDHDMHHLVPDKGEEPGRITTILPEHHASEVDRNTVVGGRTVFHALVIIIVIIIWMLIFFPSTAGGRVPEWPVQSCFTR